MTKLLDNCNFISIPGIEKERKLKVDVFTEQNVYQKVVEVAKEKVKDQPIIIILRSIEDCKNLKDLFVTDRSFVFGEGRVPA